MISESLLSCVDILLSVGVINSEEQERLKTGVKKGDVNSYKEITNHLNLIAEKRKTNE